MSSVLWPCTFGDLGSSIICLHLLVEHILLLATVSGHGREVYFLQEYEGILYNTLYHMIKLNVIVKDHNFIRVFI